MYLRPKVKVHIRRDRYKVDLDESRRRKDGNMDARKHQREERLHKKQREGNQTDLIDVIVEPVVTAEPKLVDLPSLGAGVLSEDRDSQLEGITQIRKLLSREMYAAIQEVIDEGVVPRIVQFLTREDSPQLQFEAAWALTNIAFGTSKQTKVLIDNGAVPKLIKLLSSSSDDVQEQAAWALGNIAGDSSTYRDIILNHGGLDALLCQLNEDAKLSMLRISTWTLSNLCKGKPHPPFEQLSPALPVLQRLVNSTDEEVLAEVCWALSYLSDGDDDQIEEVIDADPIPRVIELLVHPNTAIVLPALRTVGNIVTGDDAQTQYIVEYDVLPILRNLLANEFSKNIKKEACWSISNILAGTEEQIQEVFDADLIGLVVDMLQNGEFEVKREAAWAIANAASGGLHEHIKHMASQGCIKPLCDLLVCSEPRIIKVCLEALEHILNAGKTEKQMGLNGGANVYAEMVEDCGGLKKIENLQDHDSDDIYDMVVSILESFWEEPDDDDEDDDDTTPPAAKPQQEAPGSTKASAPPAAKPQQKATGSTQAFPPPAAEPQQEAPGSTQVSAPPAAK